MPKRIEPAGKEQLPAAEALNFTAGGLGYGPPFHQKQFIDRNPEPERNPGRNLFAQYIQERFVGDGTAGFNEHNEPFSGCRIPGISINAESGALARLKVGMTSFHGRFDVFRVIVLSAKNDQVLEPSDHMDLAILQKSQVSGAQEWSVAFIRRPGIEGRVGQFRLLPISFCYIGSADPDLSHTSLGAPGPALRIHDGDFLLQPCLS